MANVNVIQEVEGFSFVRWLSLNEERLGLHITGWISGCDVYVRRTWRSNMHLCRIDNAWGEGDTTVKVYGETTQDQNIPEKLQALIAQYTNEAEAWSGEAYRVYIRYQYKPRN